MSLRSKEDHTEVFHHPRASWTRNVYIFRIFLIEFLPGPDYLGIVALQIS